ncbi:ankyrin repeat-containing domain protein [Ilyonectria robusta]|uniref:ankyrin repeat-containing domain protein n=1 Tax=Ilyonectria robusta TaxID=1079257 RepID=UPI001E8D6E5E|nr:ankyrin repeat-containing domain protein [Ilyonectria robusta]KAH8679346.1 ankyrin repeat-containing domain protein [Ilyonectria robusta]
MVVAHTKRTLLMKAVKAQNVDITLFLLSRGAPVNDFSDISGTALHIAIENDDLDMINILLQEGAGVNIVDAAQFHSALHKSVWRKNIELATLLLEHGAAVDSPNASGETPLQLAFGRGGIDLVQQLLDRGAEVNTSPSQTYMGHGTALQLAAVHSHFNIARLLIENGADINVPPPLASSVDDARVATALQRAAKLGRMDIVSLLLQNDRDRDMIQVRCKEAAAIATRGGHHVVARILRDYNPLRT